MRLNVDRGPERLPRGRHRLQRGEVEASQRGRLLVATARAVAAKGYVKLTVTDIVELAAVSRRTFYEQFDGREACFLAAYDLGVEYTSGQIAAALERAAEVDWRDRMRTVISTHLQVLAADPEFAQALHVEVLAAGPAALERRAQVFALFTERTRRLYELARERDATLPEHPPAAFQMVTAGIDELIRECLRTRGAAALPQIADETAEATFALLAA